jgi:drug/metabolite transporter (DMT)-like permease
MMQSSPLLTTFLNRIPGRFYLWLAAAIFGAASPIARKITDIGARHLVNGHNPISPCNILFAGNLCALAVLIPLYRRDLDRHTFSLIPRQQLPILLIVAILAGALAPGLVFQALTETSVTNVVLIGRLEPPLTLALSIWFLQERVDRWQILGAIVAAIGVVLTIWLQPMPPGMSAMGLRMGGGELLAMLGAIVSTIATLLSKQVLLQVPLSIFSIVRTGLGTLVFAIVAIHWYGTMHFQELTSPFLWEWMLLYGMLVVVIGQSAWGMGIQRCSAATVGTIGSLVPVFSIVTAFLILAEVPNFAQYIGGGTILLGLYFSRRGMKQRQGESDRPDSLPGERTIASRMGFKGM